MTSKRDEWYMGEASRIGCLVCYLQGHPGTPAEIHHRRTGTGAARRGGNDQVLPLCTAHHRGFDARGKPMGLHSMGRKAWEREIGYTEVELIERTREMIGDPPVQ